MARTTLTEKTHARAVHLFKTNSAEDALQRVAFSKGAEWGWHARGRAERITKAVEHVARLWWLANRPSGWTLEQHLESPTVNCPTNRDKALATAVANLERARRKA